LPSCNSVAAGLCMNVLIDVLQTVAVLLKGCVRLVARTKATRTDTLTEGALSPRRTISIGSWRVVASEAILGDRSPRPHGESWGWNVMWSAIASVILGVIGWALAKLLFEPLKEIIDLRREAQECLLVYGDLSRDAPSDERHAAAQAFRRVGAGLVSRHLAAYRWVK
jgi:hypothetical protein